MLDAALLATDADAAIEALADATMTWSSPAGAAAVSVPVLYDAGSADALGSVSTAHAVRFATAALPDIAEGDTVAIGTATFRVVEVRRFGDGRTAVAGLHKFAA
jgi:hypothetical protein